MSIIALSKKRYTTKAYDSSKKIPTDQMQQLYTLLRNCPSSVNSQPWHFIVAESNEGKAQVAQGVAEFNRDRIVKASHVVVFCVKAEFTEAHLNNLLEQEDKDGRFPTAQNKKEQDAGRRHFLGVNNTSPKELLNWESKQAYIALSALLHGAASLGIDSTPIEGFDVANMSIALGLKEKGLVPVVVASLGYHAKEDFNAQLPKSRLPEEQVFTFL